MSGYTGFCNIDNGLSVLNNEDDIINKITSSLIHSTLEKDFFIKNNFINIGYKSIDNNKKCNYTINGNTYHIIFDGNLYNLNDLKENLISVGIDLESNSNEEVLLKSFLHYDIKIFQKLNGNFSFIIFNQNKKELILCRDHFGLKPMYYTFLNNTFIFSTEIKSILKYPGVETKLDNQGIGELLGIGPAHTPGYTIFKNIYELKPANFAILNESGFKSYEYWKLETKEHTDNFNETCNKVKYILEDSINKQLVTDKTFCTMLSGGLDSSILTAYASKFCSKNNIQPLITLSVDYLDNDKNFIKSDFQPNSDNYYIEIMKKTFNTNHHQIIIDTPELANALEAAMLVRDMPGMADVDSSLLIFCKHINNYAPIAISGECSDEIFAGYPWFFREDALNSNTFPWSIAISERQQLLNKNISEKISLKDYIDYRYNESINKIEYGSFDSKDTKSKRTISYLTMNWFMQTLIDRADKTSMYSGLELRVPFCDYRLVQYMWNVPWEIKAYNGREKGLLRHITKDLLPEEIINRKKSPYPKTHNPSYLKAVKEMLSNIMQNPNSPINALLNQEYILNILNTDGASFTRPWFGQLMTGPQLMAYICQVNMWLETYKPKIEL